MRLSDVDLHVVHDVPAFFSLSVSDEHEDNPTWFLMQLNNLMTAKYYWDHKYLALSLGSVIGPIARKPKRKPRIRQVKTKSQSVCTDKST